MRCGGGGQRMMEGPGQSPSNLEVVAVGFDLTTDADALTCSMPISFQATLSERSRGLLKGISTSAAEIPCRGSIPE